MMPVPVQTPITAAGMRGGSRVTGILVWAALTVQGAASVEPDESPIYVNQWAVHVRPPLPPPRTAFPIIRTGKHHQSVLDHRAT
jgi:hypothetical protein